MKRLIICLACMIHTGTAYAGCYGTTIGNTSYRNCDDGNTYNTTRIGGSRYTNGYNGRTGSSWSSSTSRIGNSTYTSGRDSDGNTWNSSGSRIGNTYHYSGFDSDGNYFSGSRTKIGDTWFGD